VIPTFNAGAELPWLVRNLFAQKGLRSVEVVTVDSGSTDGTAARAAALGCKVVEIEQSRFSHSYSRNLGAEHATGDFLVFMVQDAYPVGDHWLYGLARCLLHPRSEETRLSAVSCAEHSRSDSELFYDALLRGHYGFLGCGNRDRVGRFVSEDQAELRRQGQLSDVACMIPRALFNEYRFHGRYAEDLTLGMRMIRDGHQIGMLSSIRVIHSHTRPPGYYVRRIFADVMFQSALFPEVAVPQGNSATGSLAAAFALRRALKPTIPSSHQSPAEAIEGVIRRLRGRALPDTIAPFPADEDFGHPPLGVWIRTLGERATAAERPMTRAEARSARQMRDIVIDKLVWLLGFVPEVYPVLDETVAAELDAAIEKCLAMAVGTQLALCYLSPVPSLDDDGTEALVRDLKTILLAGI
jgi:O-antigen biosynthesis protein